MNVFEVHKNIVDDYERYIRSFITISDKEIDQVVDTELKKGKLWPEPLLQFNPAFRIAGKVADLAKQGIVHREVGDIFTGYSLYEHQLEAIQLGAKGKDFVVTSGTGSGKSLTYIGTIFSHLLSQPGAKGVVAVVVYPLNALINSQTEEFTKYQQNYRNATGRDFPISFGQYTGQEDEGKREKMRSGPPQILLTNYMMLELLLTRLQERTLRDAIYDNLRYLVFDELHTYRGRQGADVAMLIRRIRAQCKHSITCIGTSATMVSGGSALEQRGKVADVATMLFGKHFDASQVVNETLDYSLDHSSTPPTSGVLSGAIRAGIDMNGDINILRKHPVALWLEREVALKDQNGLLLRRKPQAVGVLAEQLSAVSCVPVEVCLGVLTDTLLWISAINEGIQKSGGRETVLPFRLHQFISQTGSVYTTLDQGKDRFITLEPGIYKADEGNAKPIFPNVFSRASGHPFVCVSRVGNRLIPREFLDKSEGDEQKEDGYLIIGDGVWDPDMDLDALPDSWFRVNKSGRKAIKEKADYFPEQTFFDELGNCSTSKALKYTGWFMRAPLLFDPTSGTFFDPKTREGTKLAKLGSEGRSTSTTITAFSILRQLREAGYSLSAQKLLSFTDNRQDAALQAGHFNDFVQVVHLRAGIYKALNEAPGNKLTYAQLGEAIFRALALPFTDFAKLEREAEVAPVRRRYEATFQNFLIFRALADLRRSWRIVLPNLEQCALLSIDYLDLDEIIQTDSFWSDMSFVRELSHAKRRDFIGTVLDYFRLEYALHSANFLEYARTKEHEKEFREQLRPPWTLDEKEDLRSSKVVRYEPLSKKSHLASVSMGPASSLGKYIKQFALSEGLDTSLLKGELYRDFILKLMAKLRDADYLHELPAKAEDGQEIPVYRLKVDHILWRLGDGKTVKTDVIKRRSFRDSTAKPNDFFAAMYSQEFANTKRLIAADHTGQLSTELRLDREDRFRCDWWLDPDTKKHPDEVRIRAKSVSALFCSPTMELGVDIGGLTVVHMRNAPPNAANYAQRSGRAGRSGQGALVFTYCSSYSPHDRHYFQNQADMVAGAVQAPKLDLCNRELLLTHLNALTISEIGLPGLESQPGSKPSLTVLVDMNAKDLPLADVTRAGLLLPPKTFDAIRSTFKRTIYDFAEELSERGSAWYTDTWADTNLQKIADHLDGSLDRWRNLYKSAKATLSKATQRIESGTLSATSDDYKRLIRLQNQATRQINLLVNDLGTRSTDLSEFYPFRYLASEGFLPGYNFTRLPIRIFVPTGASSGEFISRPRAVALREFGPLNVIYHNGQKYRVDQLVVQDAEEALREAKVSVKAGYILMDEQKDLEFCPFTGLNLADNANKEHLLDLMAMSESRATEVERISCEEEERVSKGFEVDTYFSLDGSLDRMRRAVAIAGDAPLLNLRYMPAARLVYVNRKWRATQFSGFPLAMTSGMWKPSMPPLEDQKEPHRIVTLWTSNLADALYIEPIQPLGLTPAGVITLQHALKRAIEAEYQVEANEIGVVAVGKQESPNILLYEASEGSLGILSRFADDPVSLHAVVRRAKEICRYDDTEYKAPASYDDLLSYYNQRDHRIIDRFLIKDALEKLLACTIELQTNSGYRSYDEQYQSLLEAVDSTSSTERPFLDYLYKNGLRLPDNAQKRTPGIYSQPDFYYEPRIWVFCDGSVHDRPEVKVEDQKKRSEILARGDEVWVYYYKDDLATIVAKRPDIFRKVR
jgi:superfamily II DNA/RNA helicase